MSAWGLIIHEASLDDKDKYFESKTEPVPIHKNIYIESDVYGTTIIDRTSTDQINSLWLIFDRSLDDTREYPFDEVTITISDLIVWRASSVCLRMLNQVIETPKNLPQIIIKLPLWFFGGHSRLSAPKKFKKSRSLSHYVRGSNLEVSVESGRPYTLGASIQLIPTNTRKQLYITPQDVAVDNWVQHHVIHESKEGDIKIELLNESSHIMTDILFGAYDIEGSIIPIKYFRAFYDDGNHKHEILSINTSQLEYDYMNKGSPYMYSHLPGKLNISRINILWEVEFFTHQKYASVYVFPRVWNILRYSAGKFGFMFG